MRFLYVILLIALFVPRIGHGQPHGIPERITGYAGYQFGMSLDQAMAVDARMPQTHCDYFNVAYCLERNEDFFGEPGTIKVLFGGTDKTITAIHITFDRFEPEERTDGACGRTAEVIFAAAMRRFGLPTKYESRRAKWFRGPSARNFRTLDPSVRRKLVEGKGFAAARARARGARSG